MPVPEEPVDIICDEAVELASDLIDGALPARKRQLMEQHLLICQGCWDYVGQLRQAVAAAAELRDDGQQDAVQDEAREGRLLEMFRRWSAEQAEEEG